VTPVVAEKILSILPPFVTPVGLFVNAPTRQILETAGALRLRHLQLRGNEAPEQVAELRGFSVIKAIRVSNETLSSELSRWRQAIASLRLTNLHGILLETAGTQEPGGTGVPNDFALIQKAKDAGAFDGLPPLIAAGGLTPESVAEIVAALRPFAVDVSTGVEFEKGKKSPEKLRAFAEAVRNADQHS
jgi:phosphoribosylanthranilate isomerase